MSIIRSIFGSTQTTFTYSGTVITTGASYAMQASDFGVVVRKTTGSATAITLPAAPSAWFLYVVKDGKGDAATNNITVTPSSGTIDGAANFVMNTNYKPLALLFDGALWNVVSVQ